MYNAFIVNLNKNYTAETFCQIIDYYSVLTNSINNYVALYP